MTKTDVLWPQHRSWIFFYDFHSIEVETLLKETPNLLIYEKLLKTTG